MKFVWDFVLHGSFEIRRTPRKPALISIKAVSEVDHMLLLEITLPTLPEGNPDNVVKRSVVVEVDGTIVSQQEITDITQTVITGLKGPQDALCVVELIDYDEAGNSSEPSSIEVTLKDTIPPAQPGELSVKIIGEEPDA